MNEMAARNAASTCLVESSRGTPMCVGPLHHRCVSVIHSVGGAIVTGYGPRVPSLLCITQETQ